MLHVGVSGGQIHGDQLHGDQLHLQRLIYPAILLTLCGIMVLAAQLFGGILILRRLELGQIGEMLIVQLGAVGILIALSLYVAKTLFTHWVKAMSKKESILEGISREQLEESMKTREVMSAILELSENMRVTLENSNTIQQGAVDAINMNGKLMETLSKQMDRHVNTLRDLVNEERWFHKQQQQQHQQLHVPKP